MESNIGHVAVIDDDPAVCDALRSMLELEGYRVSVYASAGAFLAHAAARPDCLILDHQMPLMTGLDLAARLREENVRLPVLLITGKPSPGLMARAAALGIDHVLEKPLRGDDVLAFVAILARAQ